MDQSALTDHGKVRFAIADDVTLECDALALDRKMRELASAATSAGKSHYDYLDDLIAHVHATYGVTLTLGQADELNDAIPMEIRRKKQRRLEAWKPTAS